MADRRRTDGDMFTDADLRFAAGWRHLPGLLDTLVHRPPRPDIVVDVVRGEDLVAFTLSGFGIELDTAAKPSLQATGPNARLVVQFSYQHLGERAVYAVDAGEKAPPVGDPLPDGSIPPGDPNPPADDPPVQPERVIPAKTSRLVFELPEGEKVGFTVAGVLEALGRLPMVVHPLANPRVAPRRLPRFGRRFVLPGGLEAVLDPAGLLVGPARASTPEVSGVAGMLRARRDLRAVREILSGTAAVAVGDIADHVAESAIGGVVVDPGRRIRIRPRPRLSRPPEPMETMIEAPFRLQISPSGRGGWAHADQPVRDPDATHRVELWHSRLGVRDAGDGAVDEGAKGQRIVRAIWTRDREAMADWEGLRLAPHNDLPFRMSLDSADRHMLVRQSSETWLDSKNRPIAPEPVDVDALYLSSLGAWLDIHGFWDTDPYTGHDRGDPNSAMSAILSWDHIAPMGRDQYVRVTYPGYLYPCGPKATLVKLTERKMKKAGPSLAALYQRKFLIVNEPVVRYEDPKFPFREIRLAPLVTPTLFPDPGAGQDTFFFPMVGNQRFHFILHCTDWEGRKVRLRAQLMWVSDSHHDYAGIDTAYSSDAGAGAGPARLVDAQGQDIAYAEPEKSGDTALPTKQLQLGGAAENHGSDPALVDATVELPSVQQLSPIGPVTIAYNDTFTGFDGANVGEVWAKVTTLNQELAFGGNGAGSDKAGGFIEPNLKIGGLSRSKGIIGNPAQAAQGAFDPTDLLSNISLPRLFGLVDLFDLLEAVGLGGAPNVVSEALDRIESFLLDLERVKQVLQDAVDDAIAEVTRAQNKVKDGIGGELVTAAEQARDQVIGLYDLIVGDPPGSGVADQIIDAIDNLTASAVIGDVVAAIGQLLNDLAAAADQMEAVAPLLPPLVREQMRNMARILRDIAGAVDVLDDVLAFVRGFATGGIQATYRFEWKPEMKSWAPFPGDPVLKLEKDSFVLAVEGRASGKDGMQVDVLAELRDFELLLLPGEPLVRFAFDHLSFHAGSTGKPEVDVVLQDIEFLGMLGFIETLKELIPFDGFSDPPFLDVSAEGVTAGFTLALPSVAVGVFNLSNISLGADIRVPFLGEVVTVGFNFCTRERPFTLAVLFIGGGGWFIIRLSPNGLEVLELGLEAGATLSVDFGVASGSVSAMLGIYMRLEGDDGSLAGYFRLRGEVDVLGLISASIELYLELLYDFASGKMIGSASLTVKVEVLFFSASVTIRAERRFAGSNGDPNFVDVMGLEADGSSPAWSEYCLAFAGA